MTFCRHVISHKKESGAMVEDLALQSGGEGFKSSILQPSW
jgi:hypothetical protein